MAGTQEPDPEPGDFPPLLPPGAHRLASALSVATRIEPELMRAMRLTVFPGLDIGAESDLWFSDWVGLRSPGLIAFAPHLLPALRAGLRTMLSADPVPARLASRIWDVISRVHRDLSPALFLEERVTWLAVTGGSSAEVERELGQAVFALVDEDRTGLAGWAADAWLRFPPEVRDTTTAWQLGTVAAGYTGGPLPAASAPAQLELAHIAALTSALDDIPLPLLREQAGLLFGELDGPGVAAILVPDTDPVILEVAAGASAWQTVRVARGQVVHLDLADPAPVTVRTARGTQYVIALGDTAAADDDDAGASASPGGAISPLGAPPVPAAADQKTLEARVSLLTAQAQLTAEDLLSLGRTWMDQYRLSGLPADLDSAVAAYRQAVAASERSVPVTYLTELAQALHTRSQLTQSRADLTEAADLAQQAVRSASPRQPGYRNALEVALTIQFSEFQASGDAAVLDRALELARTIRELTPPGDPTTPLILARIAEILVAQFEATGSSESFEEATRLLDTATGLLPAEHPQLGSMLSYLANGQLALYRLVGDSGRLRQAVDLFRRAAAATEGPERPLVLAGLADALRFLFDRTGEPALLNEAVTAARNAAETIPSTDPLVSTVYQALGSALQARFTVTGAADDFEASITALSRSVDAMRPDDPGRASALTNLAALLLWMSARVNEGALLDQATAWAREAVAVCAPDSPYRVGCLAVLADVLEARFTQSGETAELDDAVRAVRDALAILPDSDPARPPLFIRLAGLLGQTARRIAANAVPGDDADATESVLAEAEAVARSAVAAALPGTPTHATALCSLAALLGERFERFQSSSAAVEAMKHWREAARTVTAPAPLRATAAATAARLGSRLGQWGTALPDYRLAVELLPLTAWYGFALSGQAELLDWYSELGHDAAASALRGGQPEEAVELLEQCRRLMWERTLEPRSELTRLRAVNPELAARLDTVRNSLDAAEQSALSLETPAWLSPQSSEQRLALAREWKVLVEQVRTIVGFEWFLKSRPFAELREAAQDGPVIIVNASEFGCDAMILSRRGLSVTALQTDVKTIRARAAEYKAVLNGQATEAASDPATGLLSWLWRAIVAPVATALDLGPHRGKEAPPRVWWCPAAALGDLPLHAAADAPVPLNDALDWMCSSYIPTLQALTEARTAGRRQQDDRGDLLLIENPAHPAVPGRVFSAGEIGRAMRSAEGQTLISAVLRDDAALSPAVQAQLGHAARVYFAGHAFQAPDPAASGLLLADGTLTVREISALEAQDEFIYLAACDLRAADGGPGSAGRGASGFSSSPPPDLGTLATLFHVSGFRHVVASLGLMSDQDEASVAEDFYQYMVATYGSLRTDGSAVALNYALRELRPRNRKEFPGHATVIHVGP